MSDDIQKVLIYFDYRLRQIAVEVAVQEIKVADRQARLAALQGSQKLQRLLVLALRLWYWFDDAEAEKSSLCDKQGRYREARARLVSGDPSLAIHLLQKEAWLEYAMRQTIARPAGLDLDTGPVFRTQADELLQLLTRPAG